MADGLDKKISELREEIEQITFNKAEDKQHLEQLIGEIEKVEDEDQEEDPSIVSNIRDTVARFETEHPRATAILNDIMVTLSNMGI